MNRPIILYTKTQRVGGYLKRTLLNKISFSIDTTLFITAPLPILLIRYRTILPILFLIRHSPLLPQYQSYRYPTVHCCLRTRSIDTTQYTAAPVPVILTCYSTRLRSASPINTSQSTAARVLLIPVPVLLRRHSTQLP